MERFLTFEELNVIIEGDIKRGDSPIALFSRPGTGKSKYLQSLGESINSKVFTLNVNQIGDKEDLTGVRPVEKKREDGSIFYQQEAFPHATLMAAINYAEENPSKPTIVFLDEFNRTSPEVTSAILSFTTERKVGTVQFPENIRFVLAGNKEGNVTSFDDATATRFSLFNVRPDLVTFLENNPDLNPFIHDIITKDPGHLTGEPRGQNQNNTPNPYQDNDLTMDDEVEFDPFDDESTITEERTVPRTLTKASNYLNGEGIDQSGSEDEKEALSKFLQPLASEQHLDNPVTQLQVALEGKLGQTPTTDALVQTIIDHYDQLNKAEASTVQTQNGAMTQGLNDLLEEIRPDEEITDEIQNVQTRSELSGLFDSLDDDDMANLMLWSLTTEAYTTLDGDITPVDILENIGSELETISKRTMRLFNQLIAYPDMIVKRSLNVLENHTPDDNQQLQVLVGFASSMID